LVLVKHCCYLGSADYWWLLHLTENITKPTKVVVILDCNADFCIFLQSNRKERNNVPHDLAGLKVRVTVRPVYVVPIVVVIYCTVQMIILRVPRGYNSHYLKCKLWK
jgi:hypothetical protein